MSQKQYYVYIITNKNETVLYTGVTNNILRRMLEHKRKLVPGFSFKYNLNKLIYYQGFNSAGEAISAEKKIKGWTRDKKIELIININPQWRDLSLNFFEEDPSQAQDDS